MPKKITIEARTKSGERGAVEVIYPLSLEEAIELESKGGTVDGKLEVFKGYLRDKVIRDQRDARPVAVKDGEAEKPKKRQSVFDRLQQS